MLSDPSYADAYAPAYAKPFIAEEHMAHILGRLILSPDGIKAPLHVNDSDDDEI